MMLRKELLVVVMIAAIAVSFVAYASVVTDKNARTEKDQETPIDVTKFEAIVNGMWTVDVFVCVNISDGLTETEAELIVGTTFIHVMGENRWHRLTTITFDNTQIKAHYAWGHNENDLGHICTMTADLSTLHITVNHCF